MRAMSLNSHEKKHGWLLAVAAGFLAVTVVAAAVDRRNAVADRSAVSPRSVERVVMPPTSREMVQEMMTHD